MLILSGRFQLRREEFQPAVEHLAVSRSILDELSSSALTSHDQALYTVFADEISPEIRFAAHSLGRAKAYDIDGIVAEVAPKTRGTLFPQYQAVFASLRKETQGSDKEAGRKKLREIIWEGRPVPIRNPELVDVFLKVQTAEDALNPSASDVRVEPVASGEKSKKVKKAPKTGRSKIASYDEVLLALTDAEDVARKLAESQEVCRPIKDAHTMFLYILLSSSSLAHLNRHLNAKPDPPVATETFTSSSPTLLSGCSPAELSVIYCWSPHSPHRTSLPLGPLPMQRTRRKLWLTLG